MVQSAYQHDDGSDSSGVEEESFISTFFVRALYDYQSNDPSSLSFRRDDIIEVLTRLDSGWWDGLLGDERGWFPSNYVSVISAQEAEETLGSLDGNTTLASSEPTDSMIDMADVMGDQMGDNVWAQAGIDMRHIPVATSQTSATQSATDFWVPQVTTGGQVFYINTQTGEQSADLPHDHDEEMSDNELGSYTTLQNGRNVAGLSSASVSSVSTPRDGNSYGGFGIPRQTGTPEPWTRRLGDDGMGYYYYNNKTGQVQWTRPEPSALEDRNPFGSESSISLSTTASDTSGDHDGISRMTSDTSPTLGRRSGDRSSVYSDGSDIHPTAQDRSIGPTPLQRSIAQARQNGTLQLNMAEQIAQSLQEAMSPPPPQSVSELTTNVQQAIGTVIDYARKAGFSSEPQQMEGMNARVGTVVKAVRNLLYIAALPSGTIPADVMKDLGDAGVLGTSTIQTQLKPAQRKVTATLSKLVLSTRAFRADSESPPADAAGRLETDALELDKALQAFVMDVHRYQRHSRIGAKRVLGAFSPDNIGLGLYGGGAAATWKGFGWVALNEEDNVPAKMLSGDAIMTLKQSFAQLSAQMGTFGTMLRNPSNASDIRGIGFVRDIIRGFSTFLQVVADIHVAKHVDIDGFPEEVGQSPAHDMYMKTVGEARGLVRTLEVTTQAIYDDSSNLLLAAQDLPLTNGKHYTQGHDECCIKLDNLIITLEANGTSVLRTLETLAFVGSRQAELADGEYRQSINLRMSKILTIEDTLRPLVSHNKMSRDFTQSDVVTEEDMFGYAKPKGVHQASPFTDPSPTDYAHPTPSYQPATADSILDGDTTTIAESDLSPVEDEVDDELDDFDLPKRKKGNNQSKMERILGTAVPVHIVNQINADSTPWYLRPDYKEDQINMDNADGSVKHGTVEALIERLTAHDNPDTKLERTFMMTWKSFTTIDTLVEGLMGRFRLEPPPEIKSTELEEWTQKKLYVVRTRVLSRIKTLVQDEDDVLDSEDQHVFGILKTFLHGDDVKTVFGAKQCLDWIERAENGDTERRKIINKDPSPAPIIPRNINKKLKLLDIDPLELARQLTIMEYELFTKVRPMECILRSREQRQGKVDHITALIQSTNLLATWVADCILSREDSRRRAAVVKHFINVADRCLALRNFNTMIALLAGLNQPAIRRLKRTWEQVNARTIQLLEVVEWTMDSGKNFNNYRTTLAKVVPPCVPFFGVYLTQLTFIQDGNPDNVNGLVNFSKRHKAAEVINDMKRWQTKNYALQPITGVLSFIEESLNQYSENPDSYKDHFWNMSLEREPREREDEKMARLLQESGFL